MRPESGIDTDDLRIRLGIQRARKAVERVAANAGAGHCRLAILLIEQDAEGKVKGMQTAQSQSVAQRLNARFMRNRRMRKRTAGWRRHGILPALAVDVKQTLGGRVVGLEVPILQRPGRRDSVLVGDLLEVAFAHAEQGSAVYLRVAA